jgi:hypothetical protein
VLGRDINRQLNKCYTVEKRVPLPLGILDFEELCEGRERNIPLNGRIYYDLFPAAAGVAPSTS